MGPNLKKLISIASPPICEESPRLSSELMSLGGILSEQLVEILDSKNGFYAFESALHLFPTGCQESHIDLATWNREDSWRKGYGSIVSGLLFFAEDAFGSQFALTDKGVHRFDPEMGELEMHSLDYEGWATRILDDYQYETGYLLLHEWQVEHGPLLPGKRLLPKVPFILGGDYEIGNLYAADAIKGMEFRADIWRQIRDLPEGAQVKLKIVE